MCQVQSCKFTIGLGLAFLHTFLYGCKPSRFSLHSGSGRLASARSQESFHKRYYFVRNSHFQPQYYNYEDWGIAVLFVKKIEAGEEVLGSYGIAGTDSREGRITLSRTKNTTSSWEQGKVTVCYNDESGNVYKTTLAEDDPRVPCLFYDSKNKKREELIELWQQLNKEKDKHEKIFDVAEWEGKDKSS